MTACRHSSEHQPSPCQLRDGIQAQVVTQDKFLPFPRLGEVRHDTWELSTTLYHHAVEDQPARTAFYLLLTRKSYLMLTWAVGAMGLRACLAVLGAGAAETRQRDEFALIARRSAAEPSPLEETADQHKRLFDELPAAFWTNH